MIDGPDLPRAVDQAVPALAIRIVEQGIKQSDSLECLWVLILQREIVLLRVAVNE